MKYPFIGGIDNDCKVLLIKDRYGIAMEHPTINITGLVERNWNNSCFKNITSEYLANTYGEVKSKEHAEFIKLLAETNDIPCAVLSIDMNYTMFYVIDGCLFFCVKEIDAVGDYKKITIPLPPELNVNTPEEDFEMKQVAKNNGDNLIFGDADKCESEMLKLLNEAIETMWRPKVGDKAIINNGAECTIKCIDEGMAWVKLDDGYASIDKQFLSEYITPETQLSHDVAMIILDGHRSKSALKIANEVIELVSDFVTKKPQ